MTSCKSSESDLIRMAQCGDSGALEELLARHQPLIKALAFRVSYTRAAQQDLVQAGCLGLIQAVQRYDADRLVHLRTYAVPWILGEMKKAAKQYITADASLDQLRGEEGSSLADRLVDPSYTDPELLNLRLALPDLPPEEQLVILLRYTRDKTQKETACLLRKSQTQISRIERKAIDRLRILMT
ncbi:MAG: sigma-70 family RNA polymerase sigma factor [Clostridia bacterium]|nr:sigma-70 family RNA polymerase sigma factor [Clostridia bacterium]MBQ6857849.1 sigma-70 family RNA polymerase sigma factor [Clostridia bacterium]MBQ7051442.1 sigma-70 family RNA polymerase sigma factor [Clostridia bacterium]